jgi:(E)-4-hydroxy-3-methylbut-2-enyl-diphosphate synthase
MGDYKPEIVYENAQIREIDPQEDNEAARLNQDSAPQLVTVKDDLDLPVITAFRLLAGKLHPRYPILLKGSVVNNAIC